MSTSILLLDDEVVICDIVKRELRKLLGGEVELIEVPSGTGSEAISLLNNRGKAPHMAFIDIRLNNGLNGFDVIDYLVGRFGKGTTYSVILTGCWEGSPDWDRGVEFLKEGKIQRIIGKWGIGVVIDEIREATSDFSKGRKT